MNTTKTCEHCKDLEADIDDVEKNCPECGMCLICGGNKEVTVMESVQGEPHLSAPTGLEDCPNCT